MTWWVWSLGANLSIAAVEALNRSSDGTFLNTIPRTGLFILLAQYCLFHTFNGAPSLMVAWCTFTLGNTLVRLTLTTWWVGEPLHWNSYLGVVFITAGAAAINLGR